MNQVQMLRKTERFGRLFANTAFTFLMLLSGSFIYWGSDANYSDSLTRNLSDLTGVLKLAQVHSWVKFATALPAPVLDNLSVVCGFLGDMVALGCGIELAAKLLQDPASMARQTFQAVPVLRKGRIIAAQTVAVIALVGLSLACSVFFSPGFVVKSEGGLHLFTATLFFPPQLTSCVYLAGLVISYAFWDVQMYLNRIVAR